MNEINFFEPYEVTDEDVVQSHDEIVSEISNWIQSGEYSPESIFPSVDDLASHFEISSDSADAVLIVLVEAGLLTMHEDGKFIVEHPNRRQLLKKPKVKVKTKLVHPLPKRSRPSHVPSVPLYEQVYQKLRERILNGFYERMAFPTMSEASCEFDVSRISIRAAYKKLKSDSLIRISRGRRPSVIPAAMRQRIVSDMDDLVDRLEQSHLNTEVRVLKHHTCAAGSELAEALQCEEDTLVEQSIRLTRFDKRKFSLVAVSVPIEISDSFGVQSFAAPMSHSLLKSLDIAPSKITEEITACNADSDVAKHLDVEHGAAVLKVKRVFHTSQLGPIICTIGFFRADRFSYARVQTPQYSNAMG